MGSRVRTLLAAAAFTGLLVASSQAASADTVTTDGCIADRQGDVLLVKLGDGSLIEANAPRSSLDEQDRNKPLNPNECWSWDFDVSGQPVKVFVGQATYAGDVTDVGDMETEKNNRGKEEEKKRDRD
jgi:hypothetical protein